MANAEGRAGGAVGLAVGEIIPAHLLDGGEVVHFALKPSLWFILLVSLRWLILGALLALLGSTDFVPGAARRYLYQAGFWLSVARLAWATLEWVSRLYVLTDRRVMRIRGVFNVELFECALNRVQNTYVTLSLPERLTGVGTVRFQTAGASAGLASASWRMVPRPLEVHEKLRDAIRRAQNRGANGL